MTKQIKSFDKSNLRILRKDIDSALATIAKKHGISLAIGNISYTDNEFTTKLTCLTIGKNAPKDADPRLLKYANNVRKHGWKMGVSEADLGKVVKLGDRGMCEFVGCKDRDSNRPLIFQDENGDLIRASKSYLPRG